jgi:hypothetical protein
MLKKAILSAVVCTAMLSYPASTVSMAEPASAKSLAETSAVSCHDHYSEGQVIIDGGVLEIEIHGCGLKPWKIYGQFHPNPVLFPPPPHPRWVCNWEFEIFGTGKDGKYWESGSQVAGCGFSPYVKWERPFEFPDNTLTCIRGGVHGQGWSPYYACLRMHA